MYSKGNDNMNFTNLKNSMDKMIKEYNVPGLDCIVYKDHEMVFRYITGMSDLENKKEMKGNELYLIFSMTKMLTCTGVLQLYEQGKFGLDDPISKYLPEFDRMKITANAINAEEAKKITTGNVMGGSEEITDDGYAKNKITVKHLLTMGAGLDYVLGDAAISDALAQDKKSTRDLVGAMANKVLGFEPGTRFRYSLCHDVLGALIEVWSGKSFGEYMSENVFKPLGMNNTFFGMPKGEQLKRTAALYTYNSERKPVRVDLTCPYILSEEYESGGAGLTSCAEDYAIFLDALSCFGTAKNGYKLLSPESVKLMSTNHLTGKQSEDFYLIRPGYGYGFGVRTHIDESKSGSLSPIGEFGWDGAAGAFSLVDTKNKLSLTYFQHVHNWDVKMQSEIRNALYSCFE